MGPTYGRTHSHIFGDSSDTKFKGLHVGEGRLSSHYCITKHFSCTEKSGGNLTNNQAVLGYGLCKGIPTPKTAEHKVPEISILGTEKSFADSR